MSDQSVEEPGKGWPLAFSLSSISAAEKQPKKNFRIQYILFSWHPSGAKSPLWVICSLICEGSADAFFSFFPFLRARLHLFYTTYSPGCLFLPHSCCFWLNKKREERKKIKATMLSKHQMQNALEKKKPFSSKRSLAACVRVFVQYLLSVLLNWSLTHMHTCEANFRTYFLMRFTECAPQTSPP